MENKSVRLNMVKSRWLLVLTCLKPVMHWTLVHKAIAVILNKVYLILFEFLMKFLALRTIDYCPQNVKKTNSAG